MEVKDEEKKTQDVDLDFYRTIEQLKKNAIDRRDLLIFLAGITAGAIPTKNVES